MFSYYARLCLTKKYADFKSRASRVEYLCFISMSFMLYTIVNYLQLIVVSFSGYQPALEVAFSWLRGLLCLFLIIPACAVHVRRIHDTKISVWYLIGTCGLITLCNLLQFFNILESYLQLSFSLHAVTSYGCSLFLQWVEQGFFMLIAGLLNLVFTVFLFSEGITDMPFSFYLIRLVSFVLIGLVTILMLQPGTHEENRFGSRPDQIPDPRKGIVSAASSCLVHGYARFSGRATRSEFWWFTFINFFIIGALGAPQLLWFPQNVPPVIILIAILPQLLVFLPSLAVMIRRLHDRGKSALWLIGLLFIHLCLSLLAVYSLYYSYNSTSAMILSACLVLLMPGILLFNLILPGTKGTNKYGADPREEKRESETPSASAP